MLAHVGLCVHAAFYNVFSGDHLHTKILAIINQTRPVSVTVIVECRMWKDVADICSVSVNAAPIRRHLFRPQLYHLTGVFYETKAVLAVTVESWHTAEEIRNTTQ